MTVDEALAAAWTVLAPQRDVNIPYPRGFWPDVGRLAALMIEQQTIHPELGDWRPTRCDRGNSPEPARSAPKVSGKKLAAARAANTAALLALLKKEK